MSLYMRSIYRILRYRLIWDIALCMGWGFFNHNALNLFCKCLLALLPSTWFPGIPVFGVPRFLWTRFWCHPVVPSEPSSIGPSALVSALREPCTNGTLEYLYQVSSLLHEPPPQQWAPRGQCPGYCRAIRRPRSTRRSYFNSR